MSSMQKCPECGTWCWYGIEHRCPPVTQTASTIWPGHTAACATVVSESTKVCDCTNE